MYRVKPILSYRYGLPLFLWLLAPSQVSMQAIWPDKKLLVDTVFNMVDDNARQGK